MYPPGEQPHSGPQYPPGYPHYPQYQQPQCYPAYPQPGYPPAAPIPPMPWQPAPPPNPPAPPNHLGVGLAFGIGILTIVFAIGFLFASTPSGGEYFTSGARVTPSADKYIAFIEEKDLSGQPPSTVRCTATTDSGERLTLSPPAEPVTVSRHRRPPDIYQSVAELPTDRGPMTVDCTGPEFADFLLTKPHTGPPAWLFFVGYGTLLAIMIVAVILTNRRYYRRYPFMRDRK